MSLRLRQVLEGSYYIGTLQKPSLGWPLEPFETTLVYRVLMKPIRENI